MRLLATSDYALQCCVVYHLNNSLPNTDQTFVAIDVETTGLHPTRGDRVIEVAAVRVRGTEICESLTSLIDCGVAIPRAAIAVHGINKTMLRGAPSPEVIYPRLVEFIGGDLLVAHNAKFDQSFLISEMARQGLRITQSFQCSLKESRKKIKGVGSYSLESIARSLLGDRAIDEETRLHRALADARLTARVWLALGEVP